METPYPAEATRKLFEKVGLLGAVVLAECVEFSATVIAKAGEAIGRITDEVWDE